ncbi:SRPBCC family protein [Nocardia camponoti]|uniref:Cyclase n=1 Tax=Nocardia camponoti TaxID=1616106 RepID=A0A917QNS0_9NOCA|nr:SRPBCC family protein [Nocardia camponoti]GGK60851.1 hypothetical protein GCM10011591_36510 [Nocardia camponoti]
MRSKIDIQFSVDAGIEQVMDALLAVESLAEWSTNYSDVRVGPRDAQNRPRRVFATAHFMGNADSQVLEYAWEPDAVQWRVVDSSRGSAGGGSIELAEGADGTTLVDYHVELSLPLPIPGLLLKRSLRKVHDDVVANFLDFVEQFPPSEGFVAG